MPDAGCGVRMAAGAGDKDDEIGPLDFLRNLSPPSRQIACVAPAFGDQEPRAPSVNGTSGGRMTAADRTF